jgi:hypothetical protein
MKNLKKVNLVVLEYKKFFCIDNKIKACHLQTDPQLLQLPMFPSYVN